MAERGPDGRLRCGWAVHHAEDMEYHDSEWGRPVHDDNAWFEFITLEGAQAGLSWRTVLLKRANYRARFAGFDPAKVAQFSQSDIESCLTDAGLIRNRLKIESTVSNARAFLAMQEAFGSFDRYIWEFVGGEPVVNHPRSMSEVPASTQLSDRLSRDLKKRGFRFVGTTICYALMQATGLVDDHEVDCFCKGQS